MNKVIIKPYLYDGCMYMNDIDGIGFDADLWVQVFDAIGPDIIEIMKVDCHPDYLEL